MKTRNIFWVLALVVCAGAGWSATAAAQKPRWTPVEVDYSVPPGLKVGDEVTTVFRFTVTADVPKLEIRLTPVEGLAWVEGQRVTTFEHVVKGQQRDVTVRLRMTADVGNLSLLMRAMYGEDMFGDSVLVRYGGTPQVNGAHE